jgi:hypothetical protein
MPGWLLSSATLPLPGRPAMAHLADHLVVDQRQDFRPERGLGDMRVDVDQEIVLQAFGLPGGMREDVARVGLHGDFLQFAELRRDSLEHGGFSLKRMGTIAGTCAAVIAGPDPAISIRGHGFASESKWPEQARP